MTCICGYRWCWNCCGGACCCDHWIYYDNLLQRDTALPRPLATPHELHEDLRTFVLERQQECVTSQSDGSEVSSVPELTCHGDRELQDSTSDSRCIDIPSLDDRLLAGYTTVEDKLNTRLVERAQEGDDIEAPSETTTKHRQWQRPLFLTRRFWARLTRPRHQKSGRP